MKFALRDVIVETANERISAQLALRMIERLFRMTTYVDTNLTEEEAIVFEAGTRTDAIRISYRDFERLARPTVVDIGAKLHPMNAA